MSRFNVTRTNIAMPADMEGARQLLFKCLDGFGEEDRKAWRKLWKKLINLAPGEIFEVQTIFSRSGPFHRRHMALEQKVFDSQEKFDDFEAFRNWLKLGSGWVIWAPGEDGTLTPVPKSTSYAAAEQEKKAQASASKSEATAEAAEAAAARAAAARRRHLHRQPADGVHVRAGRSAAVPDERGRVDGAAGEGLAE